MASTSSASMARTSASTSSCRRMGGFTRNSSWQNQIWWGVTSNVTRTPRRFAVRISSSASFVLTWHMCSFAPVEAARYKLRAVSRFSARR